jgi:3'-phosphoadenosine 5'-phosphosulfate sulfotransferase (PAPS reductase)/FAD synthetase
MENKRTKEDLRIMQSWPLERKIRVTQTRIMEWHMKWDGQISVSFSGGKDSTVLLDLARRCYPDIEAVFVNTGLEYPEIREFVKTIGNVTWLRPKMNFKQVVDTYGWNYPSKEVALLLWYAHHSKNKKQNYINYLNGNNADGTPNKFKQRFKKFVYLLDAPCKISHKCCGIMKEQPLDKYRKETGKKAIIGTMACESNRRQQAWLKVGCNAFDKAIPTSQPMSFWTEQDVLKYLHDFNISYAKIYGDILLDEKGTYYNTGEKRTGCMFCPVGIHLDTEPNKFQRMKTTHPKLYDYCINKLNLKELLDYINVPYE